MRSEGTYWAGPCPSLVCISRKKTNSADTSFRNELFSGVWSEVPPSRGVSSVYWVTHRAKGDNAGTDTDIKTEKSAEGNDGA